MDLKKYIQEQVENNLHSSNYMLGSPSYAWLKNLTKYFRHFVPLTNDKSQKQILQIEKSKLRLSEFQNLFDYYNFCDKNDFEMKYNNIKNYKSIIINWIWYLVICQLFPEELKRGGNYNGSRDLFSDSFNEILSLPIINWKY